jgi:hypothetical protein
MLSMCCIAGEPVNLAAATMLLMEPVLDVAAGPAGGLDSRVQVTRLAELVGLTLTGGLLSTSRAGCATG